MWAQLQGAVIAVLEESLAVNAQEFFCLLGRDPAWMLSHWSGVGYPYTLSPVKGVSRALIKILSLRLGIENVWGN